MAVRVRREEWFADVPRECEWVGESTTSMNVVDEVDAKERGGDDDALGARCAICLAEFSRPGEAAQGVTIRLTPVC